MNVDNRIWILIGRKLAGEASTEELMELEVLSKKNPRVPYYTRMLADWWKLAEYAGKDKAQEALNEVFRKFETDQAASKPKSTSNFFQKLFSIKKHLRVALRSMWKALL